MFVRGGRVDPGDFLRNAGNYGYYWSSVSDYSYYNYYAYTLDFGPYGIDPSNYYNWYYGFPVRCVAVSS